MVSPIHGYTPEHHHHFLKTWWDYHTFQFPMCSTRCSLCPLQSIVYSSFLIQDSWKGTSKHKRESYELWQSPGFVISGFMLGMLLKKKKKRRRNVAIQSLSCDRFFVTPWTTPCQVSLSFTISWVCSNSCPLSRWCHPTISSFVTPFSSGFQSSPGSESFPMSRLFTLGGQSIDGASPSILPINIQGWSPLGLTGLISLLSKGLSRVFSSTTIQKHQFSSSQPSLWSNSHICIWLLEKP